MIEMKRQRKTLMRYCRRCEKDTPHTMGATRPRCKLCNNDWTRRFVRSRTLCSELFAKQGGCCAVCGRIPNEAMHLDHDARTGEHRELLCRDCNLLIGWSRDSVPRLQDAIAYLIKHGC